MDTQELEPNYCADCKYLSIKSVYDKTEAWLCKSPDLNKSMNYITKKPFDVFITNVRSATTPHCLYYKSKENQ